MAILRRHFPGRSASVLACAFVLSACVSSQNHGPFTYDPALIDGTTLFGRDVPAAEPISLLDLSPEMEDFLAPRITSPALGYTRFRRLLRELIDGGHFANMYVASGTYTAAETFHKGSGNCLGYTNMFIALARGAGLKARFQLVDTHPIWDVTQGYLIRNNHINVVIEDVALPGMRDSHITIDFNLVQPDPDDSEYQLVSDDFAAALYYANIAVDHLRENDLERSFAYMKRAILTDAQNPIAWNNLAILYSRYGHPEVAEAVYRTALRIKRNDKSALSGLVVALEAQGRMEEALEVSRRVRYYQLRNPYYHYALAEQAFRNEDYALAMVSIEEAIDLRGKDARFFALRAETASILGDADLAARSARLAAKYADRGSDRQTRDQGISPQYY